MRREKILCICRPINNLMCFLNLILSMDTCFADNWARLNKNILWHIFVTCCFAIVFETQDIAVNLSEIRGWRSRQEICYSLENLCNVKQFKNIWPVSTCPQIMWRLRSQCYERLFCAVIINRSSNIFSLTFELGVEEGNTYTSL